MERLKQTEKFYLENNVLNHREDVVVFEKSIHPLSLETHKIERIFHEGNILKIYFDNQFIEIPFNIFKDRLFRSFNYVKYTNNENTMKVYLSKESYSNFFK